MEWQVQLEVHEGRHEPPVELSQKWPGLGLKQWDNLFFLYYCWVTKPNNGYFEPGVRKHQPHKCTCANVQNCKGYKYYFQSNKINKQIQINTPLFHSTGAMSALLKGMSLFTRTDWMVIIPCSFSYPRLSYSVSRISCNQRWINLMVKFASTISLKSYI